MAGEILLSTLRHIWATLAALKIDAALMGGIAAARVVLSGMERFLTGASGWYRVAELESKRRTAAKPALRQECPAQLVDHRGGHGRDDPESAGIDHRLSG